MEICPYIFRAYDIRGIYGEELTEEGAKAIGKAYGTYIQKNGKKEVIVGMDSRMSSPVLKKALVEGLVSTGADVVDIGVVTTPIYYFAREKYNINPGIMITASHNPPQYNGFKMSTYGNERMFGEEIQEFRKLVESDDFISGNGTVRNESPIESYVEDIVSRCKLGNRHIKVVIDCGNGTAALVAKEIFEKIGCEVVPLYCDIDPMQPNHIADPAEEENMQDLIKVVKEENADLGIAFDGDADRVGIVDEKGNIILGDQYQIIMLREVMPKYPGSRVPVEVKCTYALYEEIEKLGGKPFYHKTGNSYFYHTMTNENIPLAGEMSGHIFWKDDFYGFDDGIYSGCRFVKMLSNIDKKCSELLDGVAKYYVTPEIKITVTEEEKFAKVEKVLRYFKEKGEEVIDVDGVRVLFDTGWGLIRASNTSPYLTMRCEAKNEEDLEKIKEEMYNALK